MEYCIGDSRSQGSNPDGNKVSVRSGSSMLESPPQEKSLPQAPNSRFDRSPGRRSWRRRSAESLGLFQLLGLRAAGLLDGPLALAVVSFLLHGSVRVGSSGSWRLENTKVKHRDVAGDSSPRLLGTYLRDWSCRTELRRPDPRWRVSSRPPGSAAW